MRIRLFSGIVGLAGTVLLTSALTPASAFQDQPTEPYQYEGDVWDQRDDKQELEHLPSSVIFPYEAAGYALMQAHNFVEDGSDVGVTYLQSSDDEDAAFNPEVTIYVTYLPDWTAADYLDDGTRAILQRFPEAVPEQQGTFTPKSGTPAPGNYRLFRIDTEKGEMLTGIWVTKIGAWQMKLRFTQPYVEDQVLALLKDEMAKSSKDGKGVSMTIANDEGIPPSMVPIGTLLQAVKWP